MGCGLCFLLRLQGAVLFDRHALGEVAGLVHIRSAGKSRVVRKELQRHHVKDRRKTAVVSGMRMTCMPSDDSMTESPSAQT